MVSKKVIIGAVIAVAVIAIAVIALSGEEEPNARLNCKVELADSFTSMGLMGPYQQMPDEGMKYAILTYKVVNDDYPDSIDTNPITWVWKITVNGISYDFDFDTFGHPGYKLVSVEKGGSTTQVLVFQVPKDASLDGLSVSQSYNWSWDPPVFKIDKDLTF